MRQTHAFTRYWYVVTIT